MPYITQEAKDRLAGAPIARTPGELNYQLTTAVLDYLHDKTLYQTEVNYTFIMMF